MGGGEERGEEAADGGGEEREVGEGEGCVEVGGEEVG